MGVDVPPVAGVGALVPSVEDERVAVPSVEGGVVPSVAGGGMVSAGRRSTGNPPSIRFMVILKG